MTVWDPGRYLEFAGPRLQPGLDLIDAMPTMSPTTIVDLGCGTGDLTAILASRWPDADVVGVDSSPQMLAAAHGNHPGLSWVEARIEDWAPRSPIDLIYSNAALHWIDDHAALMPRLLAMLSRGGVLAVQMPNNWAEPTHTIPARILDDGTWPEAARWALPRNRLADPDSYRMWLPRARVWEQIYDQPLTGSDPVFDWGAGSFLRPVLGLLGPDDRRRFTAACSAEFALAYPKGSDETTLLRYRRLFIVATSAPS